MPQQFSNEASGLLAAILGPGTGTVQLQPGQGDLFPVVAIGSDDYFMVTIEDVNGVSEICRCNRRDSGSDLLYIDRAQEGTSQGFFVAGSRCELRLTKGTMDNFVQRDDDILDGGTY